MICVFGAKRSDRVKLVWWDGTGLCLVAKKLESGGFRWPAIQDGVMRLPAQVVQVDAGAPISVPAGLCLFICAFARRQSIESKRAIEVLNPALR